MVRGWENIFWGGIVHACPVAAVCSRNLLSAAVEDKLQSWMDAYLKFITIYSSSYDPFKLCQWEASRWRQMVVSGHLSRMPLMWQSNEKAKQNPKKCQAK